MSVVDEIRQRLDIVDVVSGYVPLQKAGRNFKASCPFHSERHASFFVFPERQSWHCFGACGTGGDIFSFVMRKEGLDFGQALRLLAEKAGVSLSTPMSQSIDDERRQKLFRINEAAAGYYHHLLFKASTSKAARDYIAQRGLSTQIVEKFQLGFSPDSWEALKTYLLSNGYEETELITAGLITGRDDGRSYDRFRNRLMFPIRDAQGSVIGFGARALDDSLPKYLNSPQTPVFDKSSSLYGIDQAKKAIRQNNLAIIVEGYMDVLTAHQYGSEDVVASMGTSLTEKQLVMLKGLTRNLVLALDADAAGEEATLRSAETVGQVLSDKVIPVPMWSGVVRYENVLDTQVKVIALPRGKDPDEVIREDPSLWRQLIVGALPLVDFAFNIVATNINLNSVEDKSSVADKLLPLISEIKDPIRQSHYIQKLARLLRVDEHDLRDILKRIRGATGKQKSNKKTGGGIPKIPASFLSSPVEEYCLALLLQYPGLKSEATQISPDYFERSENRELFLQWYRASDSNFVEDNLDSSLNEYSGQLMAKAFPPSLRESEKERRKVLNSCILRLREKLIRNLEAKKGELLALEAEAGGKMADVAKLEEQGTENSIQLKEIFSKQRGY